MASSKYTLVRADAFNWLAERRAKSVHAVVTDPPFTVLEYSAKELKLRHDRTRGIWRRPQDFDGFTRAPVPRFTVLNMRALVSLREFHDSLATELHRVLVPGGHVFLASQNLLAHIPVAAFTGAGFEIRGQLVRIVKTLRGGDRPKGAHRDFRSVSVMPRAMWEPWLVFRKPCEGTVRANLRRWATGALRRPSLDRPFSDVIMSRPASKAERAIANHPSLKPQAFMRQVVHAALPLGKGTVVDPFMGSGATVAAGLALGIRSIGIEKNQQFFRMASRAIPELARLDVGCPSPVVDSTSGAA